MDKVRENRRRTKSGEAAPPPENTPGRKRYNFRNKNKSDIVWVDDDTLLEDEDEHDSSYLPSEEEEDTESEDEPVVVVKRPTVKVDDEEEQTIHGIKLPKHVPVSVKIHIHANEHDEEEEEEEEEEDSEEEEEEDEESEDSDLTEDQITQLLARTLGGSYGRNKEPQPSFFIVSAEPPTKKSCIEKEKEPTMYLSRKEKEYFEGLPKSQTKKYLKKMKNVQEHLGETEVPFKFRVLNMDVEDTIKAAVVRKVDTMSRMGMDSGEAQKLRIWVESILRVPFGKTIPLPVSFSDGQPKCVEFLKEARRKLDTATYGMEPAKMQIMQTIAQWISNPGAIGNCIAMQGPAGVGKTSFARNGIANVLDRPFMFFSLGGASDIAHYIGHSYTYEGSMWGRIIDAIIQSKCMNPVLYFDELDKISGTPHGEEITSMLIHLTDRTQNSQYHDRYFSGIDFDLSKCLFVFSYNDESKVNPILKDRMTVIQCAGYKEQEKKVIIANYVWPEVLGRIGIKREELSATEEAAEYIIKEYSKGEEGMRSLIRVVESIVSRINLLRISDEETKAKYKFAIPVTFPMKLDVNMVKKLMTDYSPKEPEVWRSLYN
jgi:ATP-dependent Lon protease